jgi:hypothetical protein
MNFVLPWKPDEPCPCGGSLPLKGCCLGADGVPRIKVPNLVPTGPVMCLLKNPANLKFPRCGIALGGVPIVDLPMRVFAVAENSN